MITVLAVTLTREEKAAYSRDADAGFQMGLVWRRFAEMQAEWQETLNRLKR